MLFFFASKTCASDGTLSWANSFSLDAGISEFSQSIAADRSGNIYLIVGQINAGSSPYQFGTIKYSNVGVILWTNIFYNTFGNRGSQYPVYPVIKVDGNNDAIAAGSALGSGIGNDFITIKYSASGMTLWTNRFNGTNNTDDSLTALAVDANNDVVVTGYSTGSLSGKDCLTIKYSTTGAPLWTNRFNGTANSDDQANAIATDGNNNVLVAGYSSVIGGGSGKDFLTIKYSAAGVALWTNLFNGITGTSDDKAVAIASDRNRNVYVTGVSSGSTATGGSGYDFLTIKYSEAGVALWTNRFNGSGNRDDQPKAIAMDGQNDVIVFGSTTPDPNTTGSSGYDFATIKYSSAGVALWTNRFNGSGNYADTARALAVDGSNNVFVCGETYSTGNHFDFETIKYSSGGGLIWAKRYNALDKYDDSPFALTVDGGGNVWVTGYASLLTGLDIYTIEYSGPGVLLGINYVGNQPAIFWPAAAGSNFVLQTVTNFASTNWITASNYIFVNNLSNIPPLVGIVITNVADGAAFFRLK